MDRLIRKNVLAMSGRAVEAAGDVDMLLLDKTGTITLGNRMATELIPVDGVARARTWPTRRSWPAWPTRRPRGARSSCWSRSSYRLRGREMAEPAAHVHSLHRPDAHERLRPRRPRASARAPSTPSPPTSARLGGSVPARAGGDRRHGSPTRAARRWPWPTATRVLGVIHLKDMVKGGIQERFARFRAMGIRTVMITGDNPRTAAAIAARGGRRRLPGRGHARSQDAAHPGRAGQGQAGGDDRRRHQRRPGAGPGRRRAWP